MSEIDKQLSAAGNTLVPAILALEARGFELSVDQSVNQPLWKARNGNQSFTAEDPLTLLGLIRLTELRGPDWQAEDHEIDEVIKRYELAG